MSYIQETIKQLYSKNASTPYDLIGGAYCASFESKDYESAWVQLKTGVLNISYPFEISPDELLKEKVDIFPKDAKCQAWESGIYATFEFKPIKPESAADLIDAIFRKLYELPEGYSIDTEFIDVR